MCTLPRQRSNTDRGHRYAGGTRTCIHTPGADLKPADVNPDICRELLSDAQLVYFDGRLTEAALVVAKVARDVGIPVLVEAERLRPGLELLLAEADYIVTSNHFPQDWTGEETIGDAMLATAMRLPKFKWMVRSCRLQCSSSCLACIAQCSAVLAILLDMCVCLAVQQGERVRGDRCLLVAMTNGHIR